MIRQETNNKNYLFVCDFGESRSKYFAENFMKNGFKAMFCGIDDAAIFKITENHIHWAEEIIILSENVNRHWSLRFAEHMKKNMILFHIEDKSNKFESKLKELMRIIKK